VVGSHLSDNHDGPTLDWFLVTVQFVWRWSPGTVVVASPIIEYHSFHEVKTHASADLTSGPPWVCLELLSAFDKSLPVENEEVAPTDLETAIRFGAAGIGLARTEHMFFGEERVLEMRRLILAESEKEATYALEQLLHFQQEDNQSPLRQNG
jgi:hypothetical protein